MASPGTYISGAGHVGLVVWLIAGWGFQSDPLPFDVTEVSVVSGAEYAAIVAATSPDPGDVPPDTPAAPAVGADPVPAAPEEQVAVAAPPAPVIPPAAETPPPERPTPPPPVADVTDQAPDAPAQPVEPTPQILAPVVNDTPVPDAAPRVAPTPVEAPDPDVAIADVPVAPTQPDQPSPDAVPVEPVEAAAPEQATTEIVTEAEKPSGAVEVSMRPQVRPDRPTPEPDPAPPVDEPRPPTTAQTLAESDADVDAAVAAAIAAASLPSELPQGPPMSASERDGFRVAVNRCWNVDPGSVAARVTIEVGFSLDQSGKVTGEVRLIGSDGDGSAVDTAFQAARRAILRCQGQGYDLPAEKYEQWRDVVITFDPSGMRLR